MCCMVIGIISDSHDRLDYIEQAVAIFNSKAVDYVIHCGDVVSPFSAAILNKLNCEYTGVFGNNDGDWLMINKITKGRFFKPPKMLELSGKSLIIFHEPFIVDFVDKKIDFVLYGHTHKKDLRKIDNQLIINPGTSSGYLSDESSVCLLDLQIGSVNFLELQ
mgnify:CR=1 FL=1